MLSKNFEIFKLWVLDEMSLYTENKSTTIFFAHALFLSYQPVKVYRIDMDHLVYRNSQKINSSRQRQCVNHTNKLFAKNLKKYWLLLTTSNSEYIFLHFYIKVGHGWWNQFKFFVRKGLCPYIITCQMVFQKNLNRKIKTHFPESD